MCTLKQWSRLANKNKATTTNNFCQTIFNLIPIYNSKNISWNNNKTYFDSDTLIHSLFWNNRLTALIVT
jgi:uncharacterized protein (UPF0333 family)